jgi:NADPH:quinone reductase-like Zn-dependent oxidoreductase
MKAIVFEQYGDPAVLKVAEVAKPIPTGRQVLLKVHAAAVNPADYVHVAGATRIMTGWSKPKLDRVGLDVAGVVEAVGEEVTRLKPGDAVYGACIRNPNSDGRDVWLFEYGAYAEYALSHEDALDLKPDNVSFEEAAPVASTAWTALQGLRTFGKIKAGQKVLISSATGGVGTFAVQIAKALGAEVTGVCSTKNLDLVRSLGADFVVDYTNEDYTKQGRRYDLIFDSVGEHSFGTLRGILNPGGKIIVVGKRGGLVDFFLTRVFYGTIQSWFSGDIVVDYSRPHQEDLRFITELLAAGKIRAVVAKTYSGLAETPNAVQYVKEGRAYGKVVIAI